MFRIPTITKNLLIINVLMFLALIVFEGRGIDLNDVLGLHFFLAPDFHFYQLFTYMFMHGGFTHILFNMFTLWMFGGIVEQVWGPKKFLFYYIACGVGAGLIQMVAQLGEFYMLSSSQIPGFDLGMAGEVVRANAAFLNMWTTVGASGAIYGLLLAFGMLFPEQRLFIFPLPVPIKAKWMVCIWIVVELFSALGTQGSQVAHFAHLGGMLFGYIMIRYWRNHPGNGGYGRSRGQQFFDRMKDNWERRTHRRADDASRGGGDRRESDWDYNARRKAEQDEIDRILDKVRRSGYDSLTDEEKRKLFDGGK